MEALTAADPRIIGEFQMRARLGHGGMGRVYLGTSMAGRFVAVKVIHPELTGDPEFARRFRTEAAAAQRVSGMYTAPVVAAGVDDSPPWLATAFVPGPSLQDVVAQFGPLPTPALWRLAAGLAEALRAIHSAGLIHRDLKPANVLLATDGPRVIDFGISRVATDTRLTSTGAIIGTPGYMSPEQVEGDPVGPESDVFSLGSVLAFAACGVSPFSRQGMSAASVMYRVVHAEPELGTAPNEVSGLITACLAKDPAQRPDLGQVAVHCATASGHLRLSPTAFWPGDVAAVIEAQQAALSARLQTLQVPVAQAEAPWAAPTLASIPNGPGVPAGQGMTYPPVAYPVQLTPGGSFQPGQPPPVRGPGAVPWPGSAAAPGTIKRRGLLISGIAAGAATISGVTGWVLTQGGAAARNNGSAGGTGPGTAAWRLATGLRKPPANPTASGKAVYFGTGGGNRIFAVAAQTGRKIWSRPARAVSAAPTVAAGMVCATGEQAYFYAFHAATGALAWTGSSPGNTVLPGHRDWAVAGDRLVIAPDNYNAFLVDTATGKQIWESSPPMDMPYGQSVVVADGIIYALGFYGTLSAIDTATGRRLWNVGLLDQDQQAPQTPALAVSGGNAYINSSYGPLYSVSLTTRKVNWTYQAEAWPTAAPVIAGGLVYFVDHNGTVHAVTMATGKRAWTFPAGITVSISGPAVAGGYVYVATQGGLQQLHATTGAPGWTYTPPGGTKFVSTPAVGNGLVFAGCDDNNLYAIRI